MLFVKLFNFIERSMAAYHKTLLEFWVHYKFCAVSWLKNIVLALHCEIEKKLELAVAKNFSWQFIRINYQMSVLKVRLVILRTLKS
jgi:hypothetical protein